jgi:hypothetical protein
VPADVFGPASIVLPGVTGSLISRLTFAGIRNGTVTCTNTTPALNCSGGFAGTAIINVLQLFNLSIPLSVVGNPGATAKWEEGGIFITVTGQKWTAGQTSVTMTGDNGTGVAFATGADNRTAMHGGELVLVTGFRTVSNVTGTLSGFAVQTLTFTSPAVPEPATFLLLATGLAALAWRVRRG